MFFKWERSPANTDLSAEDEAILNNGWERMWNGESNTVAIPDGGSMTICFDEPCAALRLVLDPDFSRESISDDKRYRTFAMRTHVDWPEKTVSMPANLMRSCTLTAVNAQGGETVIPMENNRRVVLHIALPEDTVAVRLTELVSWGGEEVRLFSADAAR